MAKTRTGPDAEPTPEAETVAPHEVEAAVSVARRIEENIRRAVKVRDVVLEPVIVSMLAEGHILVEDYPGVGKTALARSLARSIDCTFARVQCTADLLPADIVGTNVFNQREQRFEFRPGPIFANVVIVDEINRASPKTQSGLLECMQERHVTVDATSHELARPFMVFATQNPVEYEGTYPLPEAQVDRFMVRLSLGYPDPVEEAGMLAGHEAGDRVLDLGPVTDRTEVLAAIEETLAAKEQAILFLNRRGFNTIVHCDDCGDAHHQGRHRSMPESMVARNRASSSVMRRRM